MKLLFLLSMSLSLFAFNQADYSYMISDYVNPDGTVKNADYINKNFSQIKFDQDNEFAKKMKQEFASKFHGLTYKQAKTYLDSFYKPNDFLTKEEAYYLLDYIYTEKQQKLVQANDFILYFFTEDVPKNSTANVLLSVSALQDNGIHLRIKEYLTGPSDNIKEYLFSWKDFIAEYPDKYKRNISENFHLKFDPRFFKVYDIKKAPAMALAHCQSLIPTPKTCKIDYLIRGDVSLLTFFDKISKIDKKYLPYKKILEANGIYEVKK